MVEPKREMTDDPVVQRIVELLEERGITEKELIHRLGMSRGTFTAWKYGRVKSYQAHLNEIADILEVSPNMLLRGIDTEVNVETLSESEIRLIKAYRKMDNEGQRHVLDTANYIVKARKIVRKRVWVE